MPAGSIASDRHGIAWLGIASFSEQGMWELGGAELAPDRYRVRLTNDVDDPETVPTVPDPAMDDVLFAMLDDFR
ncbi:hypothetical protein OHA77_39990 [Streptosporangium sp. NBC_01639]|uniref:hypothetical protein n=1 Tax=Streptosporangium sp. NBC_01639 TaxID=2975948 RepID=UPI00386E391F|nr:hypothetical protein OHA77_39990 [Streptosporangium sp. NBC_01639]